MSASPSASSSFLPPLSPHILFPQTPPPPPPPPPPRTPRGLPSPPPPRPSSSGGSVSGVAAAPVRPRTHLRIRGEWAEKAGYSPAGGGSRRGEATARPWTSPAQPSSQQREQLWSSPAPPHALSSTVGLIHTPQSILSPSHTAFVNATRSPRRSASVSAAATTPLSIESARAQALAHATHFTPFSKRAHIMQPTAAWTTRMQQLMEEHAIPIAVSATAAKPVPPPPRSPATANKPPQLRAASVSDAPQPSPYAALIAQSSPAPAARKPGEGTAGDATAPASPLQRAPSLPAPLPLPDDLDDLVPWERDLLLHLSRVSASHFEPSVPTALHPSPLEILWTLEHFKAAGVRFERLQDAIAQAQRQKLAVRAFLNDPRQSQLLEPQTAPVESAAAAATSKPDAEEKDNNTAPAPLSVAAPGDRVDAIDLTLLFEQSRCADNVLVHLRSLAAEAKRCSNIMQLTALVIEAESNFQDRVADLWRFLSSARCFLFPLQEQASIVTRAALHSMAKALPRSTLDQLLIRCWSWNEESRQSTRIRTEEALAEQEAARQQIEAAARSAKKRSGGKGAKGDASPASPPPSSVMASPTATVTPLVFHSLRDLVHRARADEALDQKASAPAPVPSDASTPLVSFLLGPHRLLSSASAQVRLRDLERMTHALYAEDAAELEAGEDEEDSESAAASIVPDEGAISNYEQLLFHLRVLRENRAVQLRAAAGSGSQHRSIDEPAFGSFSELMFALHAEHQESLQRREALRRFLVEESELFTTAPLSASAPPLRSAKAAAGSILSDRSLMLLYFRAVRSGGKLLLHHLKHALWSSLPSVSSSASSVPAQRNTSKSALSYRRADGVMLAVQLASNHGFAFSSDVLALIRTVEAQSIVFDRWASELLEYLTRSSSSGGAASSILIPAAQQGCNIDAVRNVLVFADTGAHTISYLREWSASSNAAVAPGPAPVSLPFASLDDLVDALIAHHVSTVKRQLGRVLEEHHSAVCPALRSISDTDLERVFSLAPRSSRRMYLLLSMIEPPPPPVAASASTAAGASQAESWFDTDERPASFYPSFAAFLAELSRLSAALQAQMNAVRTLLCCQAPSDRCALWIDGAAASAVQAQMQEDEEAILPLFEVARMDTLPLLQALNATALTDPSARVASILELQQTLASAHAAREADRLPKRALLQRYLEDEERCTVLRPFFRAKRKKQEQEARSRASSAAATRRSTGTELGANKASTTDSDDRSIRLTPRQLDGLLHSACNDDAELALALLQYLQDQRWAQFESVEALVHELGRLYCSARAALDQISVRWSEWRLVSAELVTPALARRLILDSGGACIDVCWVLDHFAAQGLTFQSIPDLLAACARKWNELRVTKGMIYAALIAAPSSEADAILLFAEGPSKERARVEMQYYLQLAQRRAMEEHEAAHRRARAELPLPNESAVPTRAPSPVPVDASAATPRPNHRGSLTEMILPQQWPAPKSAATAGSLQSASAAVSFALENEDDEHPVQSLPEFDAPPFAVSVSDLHSLVMRYGFHTSFFLQAVVDQRQLTAPPPPPMQSFDELASAIERIHAAVTTSLFNFLIHTPDRSATVSASATTVDHVASASSLAPAPAGSKRGSRAKLSLHHQLSRATPESVSVDPATSLPQPIAQTGITSSPSVPLLCASLLTALALGQASSSPSAAPFSPSHPLLASLLSCAPDLSPYVLCFHLANLADPWRSNSPWMECYRRFAVNRQQAASNGLTLPFDSWAELVQAIRELHQIWLSCRDSVLALLHHNIDAANRRAVMLATGGAGAADLPLSFFPPHLPPLRMRDVDALIMHSQAGLLSSAWLRYYTQLLAESTATAAAQGLPPPPPLFASVTDLQAQLTRDVFEVSQALAFARDRLRQLLVDSPVPSQQQQQQVSSHVLPLLSREAQAFLSTPALDEMFRIVAGGFQDAQASLPLAPSPLWEQQSDASSIREALAVVTPASMHDLNGLLHHLAHCGRTFSSLSALLSTLRFTVHRFRTQVLPELFLALNYVPGRALCGFLSSSDLDQALSMDGVERLVRDSNTGIYASHIIRCWIEGVPTVGTQQASNDAAAAASASKQRSSQQLRQWDSAEDAAIAVGPFPTLDALIAAVDAEFRTTLLPAIQAHQAEMLTHLQAVAGDLFGPASGVIVDASSVADLFDRSGAWFSNLSLLRRFDEEMLRFPHFDALAAHMLSVRAEESKAREELLRFLQDPRCALFAPPPWEQEEAVADPAAAAEVDPMKRSPVAPITPRQVDRLLQELGVGSSASQALQVLQDLADRSARFASVVDLTLTLKDRARDASVKQQQVLESIGTLLANTKLVGSGPEAAAIPLSHRTLKQLLKVSGNQADVCLSLIKSLNIYSLPISADKSSVISEVVPPAPFATAAAAAASIKASGAGFGAAASSLSNSAAVDSSMSPQAKHLVSQLAVLHREVVDERDRMTAFFATVTVVRPASRSAMLRGDEESGAAATFSASAASTDQQSGAEAEEVVEITPAQLQLQAAQFNTDRCRIWKQLQAIEQALLASKGSRAATSSKHVRSLIARSALVPEVPSELAMGLIVVAGSSNRTMDLLLRLNRDEAFGFRSMSELTEALRNAYLTSLEQQRAVAQYLASAQSNLLPREGLPATALAASKSSEAEPLTLAHVLELLRAFGHGPLAAPQLLSYLQQLNSSVSSEASSTAQFSSVAELSAHLESHHRDLFAAQAREVLALLNSPECLLLRGPVLVPGTGEQVPASVLVTLRDAETLMRDSTADIYTMVHLRALRERWFQCASLQRLTTEVRVRVTWDGVEGVPLRVAVPEQQQQQQQQFVPVTPSVTDNNGNGNRSFPTTPAAAPAPSPSTDECELQNAYLDASPLEQLQR